MRTILKLAVMLPVLVVLGALAAMPFAYGFRAEDIGAPSSRVTVLGVWDVDGESLCRAFQYDELLAHRDTLRIRLGLTDEELDQCRDATAAYDPRVGWAPKLHDRERDYEGFAFEVEEATPELTLTVRRFHGDAISTTTRYRVDAQGAVSDIETNGTGPGSGLLPALGGIAGAGAWLLWAGWLGFAAWRRRRSAVD